MRDIKFRAWDKEQKIMYLPEYSEIRYMAVESLSEDNSLLEIMQYTGLKDKSGVEIYEGDIVEFRPWNREETENYIVKFISDDASFRGIKEKKSSIKVLSLINSEQGLKIIGNIFENPELVKENLG